MSPCVQKAHKDSLERLQETAAKAAAEAKEDRSGYLEDIACLLEQVITTPLSTTVKPC